VKFELRLPGKQFSDSELIDDLKRIAHLLHKSAIDQKEYKRHGGKYGVRIFADRFGGWDMALSRAGLAPNRHMPATENDLITDLRRVSRELGKVSITMEDYERFGSCSRGPIWRLFGTWTAAIKKAGLSISKNFNARVPDEKLFENLERVCIVLGRQPAYGDIERPLSEHSVTTYERRFGSWRATLEAFMKYVNMPIAEPNEELCSTDVAAIPEIKEQQGSVRRTRERRAPRAPNARLTFVVMKRDNFTCRACGRSPATQLGLILHVDHVLPWADGDETVLENLQTLCERCNLGKGRNSGT
jgi:HNH endonuclease/Homing endonuclease associated repeat